MLQTPAADGLYKRIVMQSGGARGKYEEDFAELKKQDQWFAAKVLERLKIAPENVEQIETVPWYDLAQATAEATWLYIREYGGRYNYGPRTDFKYYFGHPAAAGFREETKNVEIMCGTVSAEFSNNYNIPIGEGSKNKWSEEYKAKIFKEQYGDNAEKYVEAFKKAYPEKNTADVLFFAKEARLNAIEFCKLRASQAGAAPCYNWLFNLEAPFMDGTMAWHNAEECYVFRNAAYIEAQYDPEVSEKVEDDMSNAWINFTKTGDPNHPGIPHWPAVTPDSCPTMIFDKVTRLGVDNDLELCEMFRRPRNNAFPGTGIMAAMFGLEPKD
jgi:para-nitrobenzyl esterase